MGLLVALTVYMLWLGHLIYILTSVDVNPLSPWFYLHILVQGYFYTGLFITGHDAMHGTVTGNRRINDLVGWISTLSFAFMSYDRLRKNHYLHHRFPGTEKDPDFNTRSNNFYIWWFRFMVRYTTWWQLLLMAVTFNILKIWFNEWVLVFFWIIPAFLGTFQLFFFGTYLPHKRPHEEHMGIHKARTQKKNHVWAMLSCYFFGYHLEHHEKPTVPWWKLYTVKN
ncbi:MAG: fatty acid desaturase [Bacteroidota bacterium]